MGSGQGIRPIRPIRLIHLISSIKVEAYCPGAAGTDFFGKKLPGKGLRRRNLGRREEDEEHTTVCDRPDEDLDSPFFIPISTTGNLLWEKTPRHRITEQKKRDAPKE